MRRRGTLLNDTNLLAQNSTPQSRLSDHNNMKHHHQYNSMMIPDLKPGSIESLEGEDTNAGEIRFKSLLEQAKQRVLKVKENKAFEKKLEK